MFKFFYHEAHILLIKIRMHPMICHTAFFYWLTYEWARETGNNNIIVSSIAGREPSGDRARVHKHQAPWLPPRGRAGLRPPQEHRQPHGREQPSLPTETFSPLTLTGIHNVQSIYCLCFIIRCMGIVVLTHLFEVSIVNWSYYNQSALRKVMGVE